MQFSDILSWLSDLWKMLSSLQISDLILCSVSVIILDLFAISILMAVGRESKLCRKRWRKVSAGLALKQNERYYPLEADEILIGSHASADIRLRGSKVADYHAILTVSGGVWTITDLNEKSDTFVNQQKVRQKKLAVGDCICLGDARLCLVREQQDTES